MKRTNTGRFLSTSTGQKTPKMLEVERRLRRSLEEDFKEYHIEKGWGQTRIANRWGVQRNLIFSTYKRGGFRCWAKMLKLPVRRLDQRTDLRIAVSKGKRVCEVCEKFEQYLDEAHWISNRDGGGKQSFNILRLCPNCHRKLDRDDPATTKYAKEILLFREAKRIIETGRDSNTKRSELVRICEAIITRAVVRPTTRR
jgi:hypothetical protein